MIVDLPILATEPLASMEVLLMVLLAAGITVISAIVFVCWLFWAILRLVADGMNYLLAAPSKSARSMAADPPQACPDPICRGINPAAARFCRQCGRSLEPLPRAPASVAA